MENILFLARASTRKTPETNRSPVETCNSFSTFLQRRKRKILHGIYLQLPDDEIKKLT